MGSLLLYIPARFAPSAGNLPDERARLYRDLGVQDLVTGRPAFQLVDRGPDGDKAGGGFVLPLIGDAAPAFHPDRQTWRRFEGDAAGSEAWFGWNTKDGPVGPDDLARGDMIAGHEVRLGDGQMWEIPVAVLKDGTSPLPRSLRRVRDGQGRMVGIPGDVLPRYADLWAMAGQVYDAMRGTSAVNVIDTWDMACRTLAHNYRVCPALIETLGLFDTNIQREVCKTLIDIQSLRAERDEAAKKNEAQPAPLPASGGCGMISGSVGAAETTNQHTPTSCGGVVSLSVNDLEGDAHG